MPAPLDVIKSASLRQFNTFGIDATAFSLATVSTVAELSQALQRAEREPFILGGGSNLLLTGDLDRAVVLNRISGIEVIQLNADSLTLRIGAGENWHGVVSWAVERGYGGIENLALIPGCAGAAPIQNIGAYGVELESVFRSLSAMRLDSGDVVTFDREACRFGYRDSVFKNEEKGKYCITHIDLELHRDIYRVNTSYGAIAQHLEERATDHPTIQDVSEAVVAIRRSKLPDPAELGNSGSFFKNPVIGESHFLKLRETDPDIVYYPAGEGSYKIPAGWLIEKCGWKGKRVGNVGCFGKQALVIVNYGGATGQEVWDHALRVQDSVRERFGIALEPEVNVIHSD